MTMVGIKGQRGRSQSSPAQQAQARRGGSKSAPPAALAEIEEDPAVALRLKELAKRVGHPSTIAEAKTWEQTRAEIYRTLAAAVALAEARRTLVPRAALEETAAAVRDQIAAALDRVPRQVAETCGLPPAQAAQLVVDIGNKIRLALAQAVESAQEGRG